MENKNKKTLLVKFLVVWVILEFFVYTVLSLAQVNPKIYEWHPGIIIMFVVISYVLFIGLVSVLKDTIRGHFNSVDDEEIT